MRPLNNFELRNYLIQPGERDHFIDYFEEHFISPQQAVGMPVLGQFRVAGAPDRFVWLRAFPDMRARRDSLNAFYGGPVWRQYRDGANALIADSDHVHLLRSLGDVSGLFSAQTPDEPAAGLAAGAETIETGQIVIDFYRTDPARLESVPLKLAETYRRAGIQVRAILQAELAPNDFPRLPVIQNPGEYVIISAYPDEAPYHTRQPPELNPTAGSGPHATLRLTPTRRSPLRW